ncbi:MAG TPA: hypothetical protein VFJ77_06700 [Gaiellaceae bacterium]|nr:hypothetical protein [Gaiellaceae bacterium]
MRLSWLWRLSGALLYAAFVAAVVLFRSDLVPAACGAAPPRVVQARFLLVGPADDSSLAAWEASLRREGVPYLRVTPSALARLVLADPDGTGRFLADVVARPDLVGPAATRRLAAYERSYGLRRVLVDVTAPLPELPLGGARLYLDGDTAQLTAAGRAVFPYLRGPVPIDGAFGRLAPTPAGVTPLVSLGSSALVGRLTREDGVEEVVVGVDDGPELVHSLLLAPGLIAWAANGALTASWRPFLSVEVDPDLAGATRLEPGDLRAAATWEAERHLTLQLGLSAGTLGGECSPLGRAVVSAGGDFRWANATFENRPLATASATAIADEIVRNLGWAAAHGIPLDPAQLVPPPGMLTASELPDALARTAVKVVAGGESPPDPASLGPATTLPRHPLTLFPDATTRAAQIREFNRRFVTACSEDCLPRPLSWSGYRRYEATRLLRLVLEGDPRPFAATLAGLAGERLLTKVLAETLARYRTLVRVPFASLDMTGALAALERRLRWQQALDAGEVQAVRRGTALELTASTAVDAPVRTAHGERWLSLAPGRTRTVRMP